VLKNVKRKHNRNLKVLLQSLESRRNFFAASITPTNNNLAEKVCNGLLVIIQLQGQSFLAFAAANLLKISSKNDIIQKATCINLGNI